MTKQNSNLFLLLILFLLYSCANEKPKHDELAKEISLELISYTNGNLWSEPIITKTSSAYIIAMDTEWYEFPRFRDFALKSAIEKTLGKKGLRAINERDWEIKENELGKKTYEIQFQFKDIDFTFYFREINEQYNLVTVSTIYFDF